MMIEMVKKKIKFNSNKPVFKYKTNLVFTLHSYSYAKLYTDVVCELKDSFRFVYGIL